MYREKNEYCNMSKIGVVLLILVVVNITGASVSLAGKTVPTPESLTTPKARMDNKGEYLSPFTQDGVIAEWVDKAINAKIGSAIGEQGGGLLGQKASGKSSFLGGALGGMLGNKAGQKVAIKTCGGWDGIRNASDISFDNVNDMAVYIYKKHSSHPQYTEVLEAAMVIYPELKKNYNESLQGAKKN